jgi:hypothetical protein
MRGTEKRLTRNMISDNPAKICYLFMVLAINLSAEIPAWD